VELQPNFAEINKTFYKAEMQELKSAAQINEWVSKATKGKIKQIVEEIDPEIALYLVNTIYFKAHWVGEFDKEATKEQDFTTSNGSKIKSQMMTKNSLNKYYENEKVQMVTLPYASSNLHSERMIVILPKGKTKEDLDYVADNLSALLEKQSTDNWGSVKQDIF
jgi:serpin B